MSQMNLGKAKQILSKTFLEDNNNLSEDDAAHMIVKCEQTIKQVSEELESDERLAAAQQVVKDLKGSYESVLKYERAKISFLLSKIEEITGSSTDSEDA